VLWGGLGAITLLGWLYLLWMPMAPDDFGSAGRSILGMMPASVADAALMFLMWAVMMVAMMLPSAAPMIDTYASINRGNIRGNTGSPWMFASGYLVVWTVFSAAATAGQIVLQRLGVLSPALIAKPTLGALLLILAGTYQATPLKNACLTQCRSPLGFFMTGWRDGPRGALAMGLRHGVMCVGCCGALMLLLFVFGVMNLVWVAGLSIFVLLEKYLPAGNLIARISGIAMVAGGVALLA
jgi:predicted metal-binding membrane protein